MIDVDNFYEELMQRILSDVESRGFSKSEAFLERFTECLKEDAEITDNFTMADYKKTGMEVHGYDFDPERGILTLLVHEFFQDDKKIETIGKDLVETKFKRLKTFFEKSLKKLYEDMEESSTAYEMSLSIFNNKAQISKVRFLVISNGTLSNRGDFFFPSEKVGEYLYEYRVIDITYLFNLVQSKTEQRTEIDLVKLNGSSLPCLLAAESDEYKSYLTVVPGTLLYKIYDMYGQKLLEENVRTFLQFRGKVNKGLAMTIQEEPEKFFAYNNGLTATAESIVLDESGDVPKIKSILGLQIVNGGQTTSAIYAAKRNKKFDIGQVNVQMKLSLVKNQDKYHTFVGKVSECANTQNKVNSSDFFSNSRFHQDFKEHSERIFAPSLDGTQKKTRWFYERARGQYLNEQAYLTPSEQKAFLKNYPKEQMIEKKMLAKSENAWGMMPDWVSRGGEINFDKFAQCITDELEKNELAITEQYFKNAISKLIIFKETEKIVSKADWYDGGYRAQTVAYTISLIAYIFQKNKVYFDFGKIWDMQGIDIYLSKIIQKLAKKVYDSLMAPQVGYANVGQWAKNKKCWDSVKEIDCVDEEKDLLKNYQVEKEEVQFIKKEAKKVAVLDNGIAIQSFVVSTKKDIFVKIYKYFLSNGDDVGTTDMNVLGSFVSGRIRCPTVNQAKCIYRLYTKAKELGMNLE